MKDKLHAIISLNTAESGILSDPIGLIVWFDSESLITVFSVLPFKRFGTLQVLQNQSFTRY